MLYGIAKVNGRYRSLAVLYRHYDNKGKLAVDVCRRLIELFEEPRNRALLLHELQVAGSLPPEKWEAAPDCRNERPAFPFVATCLLLGASVTPETGHGYNATHEPFNMPLVAADEGCTILDVTDPAAVRYAFVFVLPQKWPPGGLIRTSFGNTPLSAWEYAAFYGDLFYEEDYRIGEDDAVIARTHARFTEILKGQDVIDSTAIASPLIDEDALESAWPCPGDQQSWRRRADLGLPGIVPRPSPASDPAMSCRQPATNHAETLYRAFEQSYRLFEPGYNEGLDTEVRAPVSSVKQVANILYLGSLEDSSWQARAAEYEPKARRNFEENAVQYFTFQVDDSPVTPGHTLDVLQSWMVAATSQEDLGGRMEYEYYFNCIHGESDQSMVKFFSMVGPVSRTLYNRHRVCEPRPTLIHLQNHRVVKPLPGAAFYYAKKSYHCNIDWTTAALEEFEHGEWTAFLVQQWRQVRLDVRRTEMTPLGFKCAFVSRSADGEITVADAETFRSASRSTPADDALRELDPGEETYGRGLVDLLGRDGGAINGVPVSLMDRDEVLELLSAMEVVKAREDESLARSWSEVHSKMMQRRARERDAATT